MLSVLITAALCAASATIHIAPDQPAPHVYSDEPLIIELTAAEDWAPRIQVLIAPLGAETVTVDLGTLSLRAGTPKWVTVQKPAALGIFAVTVVLDDGTERQEVLGAFCHVSRPAAGADPTAIADVVDGERSTIIALANMPVRMVRVSVSNPQVNAILHACHESELMAALAFAPAAEASEPPSEAGSAASGESEVESAAPAPSEIISGNSPAGHLAQGFAETYESDIGRWEIDAKDPAALLSVAAAVARGGSRAPILAVVRNLEVVPSLLAAAGHALDGLAVDVAAPKPADLMAYCTVAERSGFEGLPIHHVGALVTESTQDPAVESLRQLLLNRTGRAVTSAFPADLAYAPPACGPAYAYFSGLAHRLSDAAYVGPLDEGKQVTAHVFRKGGAWCVTAWTDTAAEIMLTVNDAVALQLTDAFGNPLDVAAEEGKVTVPVSAEPMYLSGQGGPLLARAAASMAAVEAAHLLQLDEETVKQLEPHAEVVQRIAKGGAAGVSRIEFIALLQAFPELEDAWHGGSAARETAVPIIAGLARVVRLLCVLEQEKGVDFIESLQNVIARCGEYQSIYLMSASPSRSASMDADDERGDWLLAEVNRLVTEAEAMRDAGRMIEAVGVASLAEARARSLESTL